MAQSPSSASPAPATLLSTVERIGREVAQPAASDVDAKARFPRETFEALRAERVLSAGIPTEYGGSGCTILELSALCSALARHCSSSGMILAMHFIKIETFLYHGRHVPQVQDYLRSVADEQRLVASVTSEVGVGGNLRQSIAAVERDGDRFTLVKDSSCLSYGAYADDLLITCRRHPESAPSDQVIVLARRGDFTLEQRGDWDTMGMRGTCSPPFLVSMTGEPWQVYETPFGDIAARTMVPVTHILWSSVWLGIASDAVARARACVQSRARKNPDAPPPVAERLAELDGRHQMMHSTLDAVAREYQDAHQRDDGEHMSSVGFGIRINNLKVLSSRLVVEISAGAMQVIGFMGYLHQSPFCVARHIRDAYSAALMISNDRIVETNATLELVHRG